MFESSLFLGFRLTENYKIELDKVSPHIKNLFLQNEGDYLQMIEYETNVIVGKFLPAAINWATLELAYDHVTSLLNCLTPTSICSKKDLILVALPIDFV